MSYIDQVRLYVSMSSCGGEMRIPLQIKVVPIDGSEAQGGGATMLSEHTHISSLQCMQPHVEQ